MQTLIQNECILKPHTHEQLRYDLWIAFYKAHNAIIFITTCRREGFDIDKFNAT